MKNVKPAMRMVYGEDFTVWQKRARVRLVELLGLPLEGTEPNFRVEWINDSNPYFAETRFLFESEPDVTVSGHLLLPKGIQQKKLPLVICLQGHSTGMHISLGRALYPGDEETINGGDRDFALQVVARGQAALVLDQRAFGERGGTEKGPDCYQPSVQALLIGQTIVGQRCWDVSRAIDVAGKHFPQLDMNQVAVMGNSGGGVTSLYAAAVDERIAAAMPSCAFCGFMASFGTQYHCLCSYVPGIMKDFDMGDLAGLIAPRPMIVVSGQKDAIFPIEAAKEQAEVARLYYAAAGMPERFQHVVGPDGHRFYAGLSWPVFDELTGWKRS
ncbi:MAG: acetylxylan esterase [Clostridia bacterium]|nr:acetylxylan esterase [Clostridia bacterium]